MLLAEALHNGIALVDKRILNVDMMKHRAYKYRQNQVENRLEGTIRQLTKSLFQQHSKQHMRNFARVKRKNHSIKEGRLIKLREHIKSCQKDVQQLKAQKEVPEILPQCAYCGRRSPLISRAQVLQLNRFTQEIPHRVG